MKSPTRFRFLYTFSYLPSQIWNYVTGTKAEIVSWSTAGSSGDSKAPQATGTVPQSFILPNRPNQKTADKPTTVQPVFENENQPSSHIYSSCFSKQSNPDVSHPLPSGKLILAGGDSPHEVKLFIRVNHNLITK